VDKSLILVFARLLILLELHDQVVSSVPINESITLIIYHRKSLFWSDLKTGLFTRLELCKIWLFLLLRIERVDFSELTGGFRLGESPARRERFCLFATYQCGKPRARFIGL